MFISEFEKRAQKNIDQMDMDELDDDPIFKASGHAEDRNREFRHCGESHLEIMEAHPKAKTNRRLVANKFKKFFNNWYDTNKRHYVIDQGAILHKKTKSPMIHDFDDHAKRNFK